MSITPQFPMVPASFLGRSREVDAGACFDWLRQGWVMFLANPGVWIGSSVVLLIILMAISIVPLFGQIAAHLLVPLFGAGMIMICKRISDGGDAQIADLFAGFRRNAGPLVMVGVIFAAGMFGLALLVFLLISGSALSGVVTGRVGGFGIAIGGIMLAGALVAVLSVPVIMATWFAPALVFLHDMQPVAALRASFDAGIKNWKAMSIFGIFLVVALFFAILPLFLGLLLFLPVFSGAVYASYRDIFMEV